MAKPKKHKGPKRTRSGHERCGRSAWYGHVVYYITGTIYGPRWTRQRDYHYSNPALLARVTAQAPLLREDVVLVEMERMKPLPKEIMDEIVANDYFFEDHESRLIAKNALRSWFLTLSAWKSEGLSENEIADRFDLLGVDDQDEILTAIFGFMNGFTSLFEGIDEPIERFRDAMVSEGRLVVVQGSRAETDILDIEMLARPTLPSIVTDDLQAGVIQAMNEFGVVGCSPEYED